MTYRVIFDGPLDIALPVASITRSVLVWEAHPSDRVCIVTDDGTGAGPSITNAAEHVIDAVTQQWGPECVVVEHYPASAVDVETYHRATRGPNGKVRWDALDTAVLRREFAAVLPVAADRRA